MTVYRSGRGVGVYQHSYFVVPLVLYVRVAEQESHLRCLLADTMGYVLSNEREYRKSHTRVLFFQVWF